MTEYRILQAALGIMGKEGLEDLTTTRVSEVAGVSVGTIYRRFGNKEHLVHATQLEFLRTFREHFVKRIEDRGPSQLNPLLAVEAATLALCENFRDYEKFVRQQLFLGLQNETVFTDGREASLAIGKLFGAPILRHRSLIVHDSPEEAVDYIYSLTFSACAHRIGQRGLLESNQPRRWDDLIKRLVRTNQAYLFCPLGQEPSEPPR
ncbi:TetR/AcrR family transcriptional regulator [Paeniglutamicibacter sp. MACA_103]|uniref:TetR/AcrR family transcriptional regulator n=1 Tax=Paeniglutamicibacter sp. MACA_103 TaxID=3377337 RepID=UPI003894F17F